MELWIRSQKNEKLRQGLFKVNEIELGDYENNMDCLVINNLYCVGTYKTKERALEVLDEIQNHLLKLGHNEIITGKDGFMDGIKHYGIVYEMPKE